MIKYLVIWLILVLLNSNLVIATDDRLIIHVEDYPDVEMDAFVKEQLEENPHLNDWDIRIACQRRYQEVSQYQLRQREILLELIEEYGTNSIYQEGLIVGETIIFDRQVALLKFSRKKKSAQKSNYHPSFARVTPALKPFMGNSGKLLAEDVIENVHPVDDAKLLSEANPMKTGQFKIDGKAQESREDFIIQQMLKSDDNVMILISSRDLDFGNNIPNGVKLKRIEIILE